MQPETGQLWAIQRLFIQRQAGSLGECFPWQFNHKRGPLRICGVREQLLTRWFPHLAPLDHATAHHSASVRVAKDEQASCCDAPHFYSHTLLCDISPCFWPAAIEPGCPALLKNARELVGPSSSDRGFSHIFDVLPALTFSPVNRAQKDLITRIPKQPEIHPCGLIGSKS
ncbi:hypothetical protein SRHO_G00126820 [Serrasalmus rhombeus]